MKFIFSVILGMFSYEFLAKMLKVDPSLAQTAGWLVGVGMLLVFGFFEKRQEKANKKDKSIINQMESLKMEVLFLREENQRIRELHEKDKNSKENEFNFIKKP